MSDEKKTSMESLVPLLKDVYLKQLDEQLKWQAKVIGYFPEPPPLTRWQKMKKKWKKFWDHIPDFIEYVKQYKYEEWRYWDTDGY